MSSIDATQSIANAAGIGDDELLSTLHTLAGSQQGSALTWW